MTIVFRTVGPLFVCLLLGAGCAHQQGKTQEPDPVQSEMLQLRQDNARLKTRVQHLEDRMLQLEGGGSASGDRLPVVRLRPASRGKAAAEPAAPEPQPKLRRRAMSLGSPEPEPGPSSAMGYGAGTPPVEPPAAPTAEVPDPASAPAVDPDERRSFRLEGSRLVELTKRPRPAPVAAAEPPPKSSGKSRRRGKRHRDKVIAQYQDAMELLKAGENQAAYLAFERIAENHPRHEYADNALYWKGEAAYDQQRFSDALAAFTDVVEKYGGGNKAPDALLKIGLCYYKVGDKANAIDVLTELVAAYPRARSSDIARLKLAEFQG